MWSCQKNAAQLYNSWGKKWDSIGNPGNLLTTSARFMALSSIWALEAFSKIPSLDLGVRGESESSCWLRCTTVPLGEASSNEAYMLEDCIHNKTIGYIEQERWQNYYFHLSDIYRQHTKELWSWCWEDDCDPFGLLMTTVPEPLIDNSSWKLSTSNW